MRRIVTPGADHLVVGGVAVRACSSVSKRRKPKPWLSTGSTQYPATNPAAACTSAMSDRFGSSQIESAGSLRSLRRAFVLRRLRQTMILEFFAQNPIVHAPRGEIPIRPAPGCLRRNHRLYTSSRYLRFRLGALRRRCCSGGARSLESVGAAVSSIIRSRSQRWPACP